MDDKRSRSNNSLIRIAMPPRSRPLLRGILLGLAILAAGYYTVTHLLHLPPRLPGLAPDGAPGAGDAPAKKGLVPLEAHIISKCPDTLDALRLLILPVMQLVHDKVDFKLNYIGKLTDDGVSCKHGPAECLGNIVELCARELYPDPKINLGFIMCLTRDYKNIPERGLIQDCALEHAIDFKALNECATRDEGTHGMELLQNSVNRTENVGVTISCTIRLNNEVYCIRDGGEWKDCKSGSGVNDLVVAIERLRHSS